MEAIPGVVSRERAGKTAAWMPFRGSFRTELPDSEPAASHPPQRTLGVASLDPIRAAFWHAYRHLFPPHALAAQTTNGSILISWSIMDEPHARYPYAAPVMLRFDEIVIELMKNCDARQRVRIAQNHEPTLREGLRGYDPFARFPNARVVNIG